MKGLSLHWFVMLSSLLHVLFLPVAIEKAIKHKHARNNKHISF